MKTGLLNRILLLSGITLSACQKTIIHPSDFTRSHIESIKEVTLCNSDSDCGPYSYCGSSIDESNVIEKDTGSVKFVKGIKNKYCVYMDFLCPEDEKANCYYVDEIYKYSYDSSFKPIIDTCLKEQVDNGTCKTKKCETNEDCFSGSCYSNTCVTTTPLYKCEQFDLRTMTDVSSRFDCGKIDNMKCKEDDECSNFCRDGYCIFRREDEGKSFFEIVKHAFSLCSEIIISVLVVVVLIVIVYGFISILNKLGGGKKQEKKNKKD
ncbi:hypothetical protein PIROE2DRAFT_63581 [Piromyces sp. E2]|nr:hypothetical protein PIROE2DRAFT_63581 [Piromyces sp. E2]|eukprot:OUM59725.1 hypothetical protein PIROE2DRAFT_63581 [Piromyces sp. E2]